MRTFLLAVFLTLALAGLGVFFVLRLASPGTTVADVVPSPVQGYGDWTHKELLEHLRKKGMQFDAKTVSAGGLMPPAVKLIRDPDSIRVVKFKTAQEAKDSAGASQNAAAFSWACFVFDGDTALLRDVRRNLP